MTLIEKIEELEINNKDNNYVYLEEALKEYHELVKKGFLIPRENQIQQTYTIFSYNSNI